MLGILQAFCGNPSVRCVSMAAWAGWHVPCSQRTPNANLPAQPSVLSLLAMLLATRPDSPSCSPHCSAPAPPSSSAAALGLPTAPGAQPPAHQQAAQRCNARDMKKQLVSSADRTALCCLYTGSAKTPVPRACVAAGCTSGNLPMPLLTNWVCSWHSAVSPLLACPDDLSPRETAL
jgi:hypothetical protein